MIAEMAAPKAKKPSPMMVQYHAIKKDLPEDILLLFRLGDNVEEMRLKEIMAELRPLGYFGKTNACGNRER